MKFPSAYKMLFFPPALTVPNQKHSIYTHFLTCIRGPTWLTNYLVFKKLFF